MTNIDDVATNVSMLLTMFNQAISETVVLASYEGSSWDDSDPSVFKMNVLTGSIIRGEYQITNGYGPDKAPKIMRVNKCFKEKKMQLASNLYQILICGACVCRITGIHISLKMILSSCQKIA